MTISVLFFAFARDRMNTGQACFTLEEGATIADLYREHLQEGLKAPLTQWLFSINTVWAAPATVLHDGDEVAVIPPVSGG